MDDETDKRPPSYEHIMLHARDHSDLITLALAGVISEALVAGRRPLIRGLIEARFREMLASHLPGLSLANGDTNLIDRRIDEFDELLQLLLDSRAEATEEKAWLSYAIASASMADNHLWQDMGLPDRKTLSQLMAQNFPVLKERNVGDMKWKKFFYRQLCERAEISICKSPSCAVCCDYDACFAQEDEPCKLKTVPLVSISNAS